MSIVGPASDEDLAGAAVGQVDAIYVDPNRWGQGYGRDLMTAALDWLRSAGFTEAVLWVLHANTRGRRFYELGGWHADGTTRDDDSFGDLLHEVRYRITL